MRGRKMKRIKESDITGEGKQNIAGAAKQNITGAAIKRKREAAGLTQMQLSQQLETKAIYVCRGSVSRIENGSRIVSDIELKGIAEILKVPIEDLFA